MIEKIAHAPDLITKVNELVAAVNELREYAIGLAIGRLYPDLVRSRDQFLPSILDELIAHGLVEVVEGVDVRLTEVGRRAAARVAP